MKSIKDLILSGSKRAISKAITLVESQNARDKLKAQKLLKILEKNKNNKRVSKIGISGPPGVGKSSLIEKLGLEILEIKNNKNFKLAVLAIDPSSPKTKGSILGDKTRMQKLSQQPNVYVRPSAAGEVLGGLAYGTESAVKILEAAGFDLIIIETVGVGQSEHSVSKFVDKYIVLVQPGSGDDLQSMKRGNLELADIIVVNKADGALKPAADKIYGELLESYNANKLVKTSVLEDLGLDELLEKIICKAPR